MNICNNKATYVCHDFSFIILPPKNSVIVFLGRMPNGGKLKILTDESEYLTFFVVHANL